MEPIETIAIKGQQSFEPHNQINPNKQDFHCMRSINILIRC